MSGRLFFLTTLVLVLVLGVVGTTSAADVKVDFGPGNVVAGWTQWVPGGWGDPEAITIDDVDFTIVGPWDNWRTRIRAEGSSDDLTYDCVSFEDDQYGSLVLTISNLPAGGYKLKSYFNALYSGREHTVTQTVSGGLGGTGDSGVQPLGQDTDNCLQLNSTFDVGGPSDVITVDSQIQSMPFFCGFELVSEGPQFTFATAESSGLEYVSPAELEVTLLNPAEGQTHTVDYAVIGGTATGGGVDYTLASDTLIFNPGETSKPVSIDIINDGLDEDDETIIVELSDPTGGGAVLGNITQHTYTILDPRPKVGFDTDTSKTREDAGWASIPVSLSFATPHTVTVDYAAIGGTATGGGVDYTLDAGKLTFSPGETTRWINVALVDDGLDEGPETVVIELSNIVGGVPGSIMQHTLTIVDPSFLGLKVDLALENPLGSGIPRPATAKSDAGWTVWAPVGLGDMYMHDWRGVRDLGGTGIDVSITAGREGTNGLKCYDMCMANKAGGWPPTGSPVGGPIANTWYTSVDRVSFPQSNVLLAVYNLAVGTYELVSYHNLWEPQSDDSRECTKNGYGHLPMPKVHVWSFEDANDFGQWLNGAYPQYAGQFWDGLGKIKGFAGPPPYGTNVVAIQEDYDVMPSATTNDDDVTRSVVKFWTDGSPLIIMYESGDCATTQYIGCRGVLNAFEVRTIAPIFTPCDLSDSGTIDYAALKAFVEHWLWAGQAGTNLADFNGNGKVDFVDYALLALQWLQGCP